MTTEYFKVRNGLTVGEDKFTVDADTGNTVIAGNLTVQGDTVTLNASELAIEDNKITLNKNVNNAPTLDAGIVIERGTSVDSAINWNESTDKWEQNRAGTSTVIAINTSELTEGTNLYYTTARSNTDFDTRLATKTTDNVTEGANLYYTTARSNTDFDTRLATKSTSNVAEGTNKYYTDARVQTQLTAGNAGSFVNLTASGTVNFLDNITVGDATKTGYQGIEFKSNNQSAFLYFDPTQDKLLYSINNINWTALPQTTTELTEGNNLYYTDARVDARVTGKLNTADFTTTANTWLGTKSTTNVTEGTNLYYTDARSRSALSAGTGITYNSSTGAISIGQAVATTDSPTFASVTATGNLVKGAIRNSTTAGLGDIWAVNASATTLPYRGISIDNSENTAKAPGAVLRTFSGGAVAGSRGRVIFEKARGTAATPTAVQSGDAIGSVEGTGFSSTGWINDTLGVVPAFHSFAATENWTSNSNLGTGWSLLLAPTATTISTGANLVSVLTINPQVFASRSDSFTWSNGKTGTTQRMSLDVSGNLIVSGDLTITGNDIKNSGGSNVITMNSGNTQTDITSNIVYIKEPTTVSTYNNASSIGINAGNPAAAAFNDRVSQFRVTTASTTAGEASTITFNTGNYNTGTKVFSATQTNDTLGEFFFAGNYGTTADFTTLGPSVRFKALAAENFTGSASGGKFAISLDKIGGTSVYDAISIDSGNASIASNTITLEDNSGTDYAVLSSTKAQFNKPVQYPSYTTTQRDALAPAAGWVLFNSSTAKLQCYDGTAWNDLF
jgi:hypothetical protein